PERFPGIPRIALTATAGSATRKEIIRCLKLEKATIFIASFDRPNIHYTIQKKTAKAQNLLALKQFIVTNHDKKTGIVYCLSRKSTQEIATYLKENGLNAHAYHAGMTPERRERVQNRFLKDQNVIIVATIAFGMGIDKPNVRFVCHMDLPKCLESYYQETGRAGRDGLPAQAWMLYGLQDLHVLKHLMNKGQLSPARKRVNEEKLDAMLGICETSLCRREVLLNYFEDPYKGPCENCDTCLTPVKNQINATEAVKKALLCVYQTKQLFDMHHMIYILTGCATGAVQYHNHHTLQSFNAGKDLPENKWYSIFRQLIAHGVLKMEMDGNSKLELTPKALPILEGKKEIWLRQDYTPAPVEKTVPPTKEAKTIIRRSQNSSGQHGQQTLFEDLKLFRSDLAKKRRTRAYKIFPDKTLLQLIEQRPTKLAELEGIYGVGPKKLKKYGKIFLDALAELSQ
ncbi:MAG: RecQ family ATP-dependent DNA helicase, partial [Pseudomonadota bacterium]